MATFFVGTIEGSRVYIPNSGKPVYMQFVVNCRKKDDSPFAPKRYRCEAFEADFPELIEAAKNGYEGRKTECGSTRSCLTIDGGFDGLYAKVNIADVECNGENGRVYYLDHENPIMLDNLGEPEAVIEADLRPHKLAQAAMLGLSCSKSKTTGSGRTTRG